MLVFLRFLKVFGGEGVEADTMRRTIDELILSELLPCKAKHEKINFYICIYIYMIPARGPQTMFYAIFVTNFYVTGLRYLGTLATAGNR